MSETVTQEEIQKMSNEPCPHCGCPIIHGITRSGVKYKNGTQSSFEYQEVLHIYELFCRDCDWIVESEDDPVTITEV